MGLLTGRRAFVTGASRGIGAAIARKLAAAGADVAVSYERSSDRAQAVANEIRALGRRSFAVQADNADANAVQAAVNRVAAEFGGLEILVNNAGIFLAAPIEALTLEQIDSTLAVNVRAGVIASQAAIEHMRQGGRIISIGSNLAARVPAPGMALYALSKAALVGWTKGLARELGPRGITVNIVHPGSTDTDMNPAQGPHAEPQRARTALGRYGRAEEIAASVAFLASPEASFITGSELTIDGGANA